MKVSYDKLRHPRTARVSPVFSTKFTNLEHNILIIRCYQFYILLYF